MRKTIAIVSIVICAVFAQASTHHRRSDTLSPSSLSFSSRTVGTTSAAQSITVANTGSTAISITGIAISAGFSESNTCGSSLGAGARCSIAVTFTPTASGTWTGILSITDNVSSSAQSVSLTGTGIAGSESDKLSPTSLSFASQPVNTASASQTVSFTNTGSTAITISGITASNSFTQSNNCGSSLAAGAQCSIVVLFHPASSGTISGSLTVTDNASSIPQVVTLTGTGSAAAHAVSVAWAASTSSNVAGYKIYRSTTSGGYYSELNSSLLSGTTYTDNTVSAGTTYYYAATAVNASGEESGYSNQTTAVIP